jgi:hypothetical protein
VGEVRVLQSGLSFVFRSALDAERAAIGSTRSLVDAVERGAVAVAGHDDRGSGAWARRRSVGRPAGSPDRSASAIQTAAKTFDREAEVERSVQSQRQASDFKGACLMIATAFRGLFNIAY